MLSPEDRTRSCATELVCRDCGRRLPLMDTTFEVPGLRQRASTSTTTTSWPKLASARCPTCRARDQHLALRGAVADRRRQGSGPGRPLQRPHAADPRRPARRRAGPEEALPQGRQHPASQPLLQGPGRLDGGRPPAGAGQRGDRLRLHRQRRHRGRLARRQGGVAAYVFYPSNMERGKARACRALGAAVCQLDGNYDEANRACRELALASGIQFANITLRPFYAEGAKTVAYEVVEQLEWESPGPLRHPGRRRHALLARPQGPERARDGRPGGDLAAPRSTSPRPRAAARSRPRSSTARARSSRRPRTPPPTRSRSARPATARWSSTR